MPKRKAARTAISGGNMNEKTVKRRAYYLSKIKQAEAVMLKTTNAGTLHDMETVIAGYRKLLDRLPPEPSAEG